MQSRCGTLGFLWPSKAVPHLTCDMITSLSSRRGDGTLGPPLRAECPVSGIAGNGHRCDDLGHEPPCRRCLTRNRRHPRLDHQLVVAPADEVPEVQGPAAPLRRDIPPQLAL